MDIGIDQEFKSILQRMTLLRESLDSMNEKYKDYGLDLDMSDGEKVIYNSFRAIVLRKVKNQILLDNPVAKEIIDDQIVYYTPDTNPLDFNETRIYNEAKKAIADMDINKRVETFYRQRIQELSFPKITKTGKFSFYGYRDSFTSNVEIENIRSLETVVEFLAAKMVVWSASVDFMSFKPTNFFFKSLKPGLIKPLEIIQPDIRGYPITKMLFAKTFTQVEIPSATLRARLIYFLKGHPISLLDKKTKIALPEDKGYNSMKKRGKRVVVMPEERDEKI